MAVEDAVELDGQRQRREGERTLVADLGSGDPGRPIGRLVRRRLAPTASATSRSPLPRIHRAGTVSSSSRASVASPNGAGKRVTADDDDVRIRRARIGEDGVERLHVPVDVVQREDPHARDGTRGSSPRSPAADETLARIG